MTDFGSGIRLDDNFDLSISERGDIHLSSGLDQLQSDLAVRIAEKLKEDGIGIPRTEFGEDIRIDLGILIAEDPRIEQVTEISVSGDGDDPNQLNVTIETNAADGPFDMVIPLLN